MNIFDLEFIIEKENELVLWKGQYLFEQKKVSEIKPTEPDSFTVQVEGSKPYTVNMTVYASGEIEFLSCTCPYAVEGKTCKHKAAALLALRDDFFNLVELPSIKRYGFDTSAVYINGKLFPLR